MRNSLSLTSTGPFNIILQQGLEDAKISCPRSAGLVTWFA